MALDLQLSDGSREKNLGDLVEVRLLLWFSHYAGSTGPYIPLPRI